MKRIMSIVFLVICLITCGTAQKVQHIEVTQDKDVTITGNLANGKKMKDLSWAWNSSVACFPALREQKFTGNHVLYWADVPRFSEMEVNLIPDDPETNFSLYAYVVGKVSANNTVPNLTSCIRCEADFKWEYKRRGRIQDYTRTVRNLVALNHPYQVVIGVSGAGDLTRGKYKLVVKVKSR